jgi:predicted transcriptional regulator
MPTATHPPVRHGSKLSYEELQQQARTVLNESDWTQREIAEELDVTRGSVAKAVTQPGPRYQRLQMRIIERLTDYQLKREETVHFRALRKDRVDGE